MSTVYQKQANHLALRWVRKTAGWWAFDPNIGPGITSWKDKPGYTGDYFNGDGPADIMDQALKDIESDYINSPSIGRSPKPLEMQAVFDFCFDGWKSRTEDE